MCWTNGVFAALRITAARSGTAEWSWEWGFIGWDLPRISLDGRESIGGCQFEGCSCIYEAVV